MILILRKLCSKKMISKNENDQWLNKIGRFVLYKKMEPEQKLEYDNLRKVEKLWEKALKGAKGNCAFKKF